MKLKFLVIFALLASLFIVAGPADANDTDLPTCRYNNGVATREGDCVKQIIYLDELPAGAVPRDDLLTTVDGTFEMECADLNFFEQICVVGDRVVITDDPSDDLGFDLEAVCAAGNGILVLDDGELTCVFVSEPLLPATPTPTAVAAPVPSFTG